VLHISFEKRFLALGDVERYLNAQLKKRKIKMDSRHDGKRRNGYLLFCEWRKPYVAQHTYGDQKQLFRNLGELWNQQTQGQKIYWNKMAQGRTAFDRPLNPYMLFCNVVRDDISKYELQKSGRTLAVTDLGRRLGSMWRSQTDPEREFWKQQSLNIWGNHADLSDRKEE
jgi:hypothetical protein